VEAKVAEAFRERYGHEPETVVRAPGRVNLIGEHTDYSLLPVLPIAISEAVYLAASADDSGRLRGISLSHDGKLNLDRAGAASAEGWHRYPAGVLSAIGEPAEGKGAHLVVGSTLPATGGLSSSSALTLALVEALARVWDLDITVDDEITLASRAERAVGIESGLMDQTVITFAEPGAALRIDFDPLQWRPVPLPEDVRIVAAYSGTDAVKTGTVGDAYDARVVGCRIAAVRLAELLGGEVGHPPALGRVADVHEAAEMVAMLPTRDTVTAAADELGLCLDDIGGLAARLFPPDEPVPVHACAEHVLGEAKRVDEAEAALQAGDLEGFGALLDASHASLTDYGVSTPALDQLCVCLREAGAAGARLTGAGFGGFAIAAAPPAALAKVIAAGNEYAGLAFEAVPSAGMVHGLGSE
jgi:galactokinase